MTRARSLTGDPHLSSKGAVNCNPPVVVATSGKEGDK
jgi:hypothetical protein